MKEIRETRVENWCGYDIRFVDIDGEWYAVLRDICKALNLTSKHVAERLDPDMMERVPIKGERVRPVNYNQENYEAGSNDLVKTTNTFHMLVVNEIGIYEALFASRRLEARKFRRWTAGVMQKLRTYVGLQGYEALRLTDEEIQDQIDDILDCLFWDEETNKLMVSVTVHGGDVEQVEWDEYMREVRGK